MLAARREDFDMLLLNSAEAKQRFEELMEAVTLGEGVTIELDNGQRVKLVIEESSGVQRQPGTGKGLFIMADDFDEPMEDIEESLYMPNKKPRAPGSADGQVWMADDFDSLF
jgi:antitoxin (DNA-binding transcriptional repressor) of toxin-antitoxin stability system